MDNEPLILDMLQWIGAQPRAYADVMDAWRTSCPRLTIWEDAVDRGLVDRNGSTVTLSCKGFALLDEHRPLRPATRSAA